VTGSSAGSSARTATGVTVSITHDPALVRTVRLVAAAVARRAGQDDEFVEEVRLAVGEACALLIERDGDDGATDPVEVRLLLEDRLRVRVQAPGLVEGFDALTSDIDGVEPWALLRGLIDDFEVTSDASGTALTMSWPLE
jgi:anti-sigma regulatory factor (Ser/Thr protein kinase)